MSTPWKGKLRLTLADSSYGHMVHATEPNERGEYEHIANVFGEAQVRALVHRANAYEEMRGALEEIRGRSHDTGCAQVLLPSLKCNCHVAIARRTLEALEAS